MYIDDCNVGKLPGWGAIYEMTHNCWSYEQFRQALYTTDKKRKGSLWKRLFK